MKIIGHTLSGDYIVVIPAKDYEHLVNDRTGLDLKLARHAAGLTLKEVSAKTGISVSFLSDIERGKTSPSLANWRKLKAFYGLEAE